MCGKCGAAYVAGALKCENCGTPLCGKCGVPHAAGALKCENCNNPTPLPKCPNCKESNFWIAKSCKSCGYNLRQGTLGRVVGRAALIVTFLLALAVGGKLWVSYRTARLRMSAPRLVGEKLMLDLATKYLADRGARPPFTPSRLPGAVNLTGFVAQERTNVNIEIVFRDSPQPRGGTGDDRPDLIFTWGDISTDENKKVLGAGVESAAAGENSCPLAQDRVVVIVNRKSPVKSLTLDQVKGIFTGRITRWSELPASTRGELQDKIYTYVPSRQYEIVQMFRAKILKGEKEVSAGMPDDECSQVEARVEADERGIGFVNLANKGTNIPIEVAEGEKSDLIKSIESSANLTRQLEREIFIYLPEGHSDEADRFLKWARELVGSGGGNIIEGSGFVSLITKSSPIQQDWPDDYKLIRGAETVVRVNDDEFHCQFDVGHSELEKNVSSEIEGISASLVNPNNTGPKRLWVLGFADNDGSPKANQSLSEKRAQAVANRFRQLGVKDVHSIGFGDRAPLDRSGTTEGQGRNRRVELYLMP